jgi:release factor glutamine methyltransferase
MTIKSLFLWINKEVDQAFLKTHKREIEDLICFSLKLNWSDLLLKENQTLNPEQKLEIEKNLKELLAGKPLAYIIGEKYFYNSLFKVNENVLIPRPETEMLVEISLNHLESQKAKIMDLGTGSGCIGLSIAKERPMDDIYLIDASPKAIEIAQENAKELGIKNNTFIVCEIGIQKFIKNELKGQIDLIVSNPPYIEWGDSRVEKRVHEFEPHQALYATEKGLFWIHKFLIWGYDYLKKEGLFIFEFGQNQESEIQKILEMTNYQILEIVEDYSGIKRFFKLKK